MEKHLKAKIYGKVQGVSFRYCMSQKALELSLFGFARNDPDGTVYVEAEGSKENLDKFLEWCYKGPKEARVKNIKFTLSTELEKFDKFRIY